VIDRHEWELAFREVEKEAVHPSAQEIAAAFDGLGSDFTRSEVRAHTAWCGPCGEIARDFEAFASDLAAPTPAPIRHVAPAELPSRAVRPEPGWSPWWAAAAGFAACAVGSALWFATRPLPQPVVVERRVEVPAPKEPLQIANAAVIDLMPVDARERGAEGQGGALPDPLPVVATFILNDAAGVGAETPVRVRNAGGRVVWTGVLKRQKGVFTLALGGEVLREGPLVVELGGAVRYRIGR
jgi:hypothetical protein